MAKLGELLEANHETLFKLHEAGIRNIDTALSFIQIAKLYDSLDHVKSKSARKAMIADRMVISKRTVENALNTFNKDL